MLTDTTGSPYAKVHALDGMKVKWTGGLWKERFDTCANSTVPQLKHMFDSKDISHVVENFKICAGDSEGDFDGTVFGDGDFYKWMESAIYTAYQTDNQLQISFITSSTVHFHKSHIMRRADGSLNFSGALCFFVKMLQIICGFSAIVRKLFFPVILLCTHAAVNI